MDLLATDWMSSVLINRDSRKNFIENLQAAPHVTQEIAFGRLCLAGQHRAAPELCCTALQLARLHLKQWSAVFCPALCCVACVTCVSMCARPYDLFIDRPLNCNFSCKFNGHVCFFFLVWSLFYCIFAKKIRIFKGIFCALYDDNTDENYHIYRVYRKVCCKYLLIIVHSYRQMITLTLE